MSDVRQAEHVLKQADQKLLNNLAAELTKLAGGFTEDELAAA
jgi:hypothetical protein